MAGPKVSILVPVYNTAKYLRKCMDSLVNQTMKDVEIVCVNDGSTDGSLEILREYEKKYGNVRVISQKNKGIATTRNVALDAAQAKYIMFMDSDDSFELTACEKLYGIITTQDVDIAQCAVQIIYEHSGIPSPDTEEYLRLKYTGKQKLDWLVVTRTDASLVNKIYKKELIDKYNIRFPDGYVFEDALFNDCYLAVSDSIYYLNEKLYYYLRRSGSIMSQSFAKRPLAKDFVDVAFILYDFLKKNDLLAKNRNLFWQEFLKYCSFAMTFSTFGTQLRLRKRVRKFIRENRAELEGVDPNIRKNLSDAYSVVRPVTRSMKDRAKLVLPKISLGHRRRGRVIRGLEGTIQRINHSEELIDQLLKKTSK